MVKHFRTKVFTCYYTYDGIPWNDFPSPKKIYQEVKRILEIDLELYFPMKHVFLNRVRTIGILFIVTGQTDEWAHEAEKKLVALPYIASIMLSVNSPLWDF
jgi:hypothetical protein